MCRIIIFRVLWWSAVESEVLRHHGRSKEEAQYAGSHEETEVLSCPALLCDEKYFHRLPTVTGETPTMASLACCGQSYPSIACTTTYRTAADWQS